MISDYSTGLLSMDHVTMQYRAPIGRHGDPIVVLDAAEVELIEESIHRVGCVDRFPPAISDWELSRLVDECTWELCQLGKYRYGRYAV